mmetsp:Transcript_28060/g.51108  ORF Transcript_28060/g.51108 Transcript_28060/m.51108 type:complete len:255 (-) Transcript_28060:1362-2126(-)
MTTSKRMVSPSRIHTPTCEPSRVILNDPPGESNGSKETSLIGSVSFPVPGSTVHSRTFPAIAALPPRFPLSDPRGGGVLGCGVTATIPVTPVARTLWNITLPAGKNLTSRAVSVSCFPLPPVLSSVRTRNSISCPSLRTNSFLSSSSGRITSEYLNNTSSLLFVLFNKPKSPFRVTTIPFSSVAFSNIFFSFSRRKRSRSDSSRLMFRAYFCFVLRSVTRENSTRSFRPKPPDEDSAREKFRRPELSSSFAGSS